MASTNAWPSVSIKRDGSTVVSRKIIKCEWTDTLGAIVERVDPSLSRAEVKKVLVSSNAQFLDPVHEIPLDGPVELLKDYGMNVLFHLCSDSSGEIGPRRSGRNAFEVLMSSS